MIAALMAHFAARAWSFAYFIPRALRFENPGDLTEEQKNRGSAVDAVEPLPTCIGSGFSHRAMCRGRPPGDPLSSSSNPSHVVLAFAVSVLVLFAHGWSHSDPGTSPVPHLMGVNFLASGTVSPAFRVHFGLKAAP